MSNNLRICQGGARFSSSVAGVRQESGEQSITLPPLADFQALGDPAGGERFAASRGVGTLCRDLCFGGGLVMRSVGDTMSVSPPLVMTRAEIDELIHKAHTALDDTLARLGDPITDNQEESLA